MQQRIKPWRTFLLRLLISWKFYLPVCLQHNPLRTGKIPLSTHPYCRHRYVASCAGKGMSNVLFCPANTIEMNTRLNVLALLALLPIFFSCINTRSVTNFNTLSDTAILYGVQSLEPVIQKNDILSISVSSVNNEATQPFNLYSISSTIGTVNSGTVSQVSGFL